MKEVKLKCYAGLHKEIPFFIQSPKHHVEVKPDLTQGQMFTNLDEKTSDNFDQIGLETRLIFHLSHLKNFSVNHYTPKELCSVKYKNLDEAIKLCLPTEKGCHLAKSDIKSAFRNLPIRKDDWTWLLLKAKHPKTYETFYFIEKAVPFGSSIRCSHFQRFSNVVEWIFRFSAGRRSNNYLENDGKFVQ